MREEIGNDILMAKYVDDVKIIFLSSIIRCATWIVSSS